MKEKVLYRIEKSTSKNKKYSVYVKGKNGRPKKIHFGQLGYQHFEDTTPLKLHSKLNHYDVKRRASYLKRAKGIKNKAGELTYKDKNSANYYAIKYLWKG
mgnify:CR=1 FL=1|tara:strand:- start:19 stop:318 length:300 start_codon:yes stop_codon:yes gene_type:complete